MESLPNITVSVTALVTGAGAKLLIGYLERRDMAHAGQTAGQIDDYR